MWFLWLLLAGDVAAAGLFVVMAKRREAVVRLSFYARQHPAKFLAGLPDLHSFDNGTPFGPKERIEAAGRELHCMRFHARFDMPLAWRRAGAEARDIDGAGTRELSPARDRCVLRVRGYSGQRQRDGKRDSP